MAVATMANTRTAEAATKGKVPAFLTGFTRWGRNGHGSRGCKLAWRHRSNLPHQDPTITLGFSLGASSLALFAKAGGCIFTKTADIAADLVGKS